MSLSILEGFQNGIKVAAKRRAKKQRSKLESQFWITHLVKAGAEQRDALHDARLLLREGLHLHDQASVDAISPELLDKLGIRSKTCVISLCKKPLLPGPLVFSNLTVSTGDTSAVNVKRVYTGDLRRTYTTSRCANDTCVGFGNFTRRVWSCHAHEVVPGLWLGNHFASTDKKGMFEQGITGVVQCRNHDPPHPETFEYLTLPLWDGDGNQNISRFFEQCNKFITSHLPVSSTGSVNAHTKHKHACNKDNRDAKATSVSTDAGSKAISESGIPTCVLAAKQSLTASTETSAIPTDLYTSSAVTKASARQGGVLVHCVRGVSRSATIVMAYLISRGCSLEETQSITKRARPVARPKSGFVAQLTAYAAEKSLTQRSNIDN